METNIVVVGGGASCISFIDAMLKKNIQNKLGHLSLIVLEKSKEIGPGNAYLSDLKSNLLNTKAGNITVFKDSPGDFYNWLECNEYKWKPEFPELNISKDTYAPRSLFGMYMKDAFSSVCADARRCGIKIKVICDEAIKIEQISSHQTHVITQGGRVIIAEKVLLACGTQQQIALRESHHDDIIRSPYPTRELKNKIGSSDNVAIIGARLSAIDATIGLIDGGHTGQVTIYSRSGYFPFVRGTQGRYKNSYLNPDYISAHHASIDIATLGHLYMKECQEYLAQSGDDYFEEMPPLNRPITNLAHFLERELVLAKQNRAWQAILYDTNRGIEHIWDRMPSADQDLLIKHYFSSAMSLRVSIPAENAEKILSYLHSGQLKFITGTSQIEVKAGQLVICCNGDSLPVDKVIYATGSPKSLNQIDSPLVHHLIESGVCVENKFGGLDVCKHSYGLFCKEGKMNTNIFAIGELTSGRFLFTSALDIILRHAHACADSIEKFMTEHDNSHPLTHQRSLA
ncbi:FAD/NAD(P)-binding protein [Aeromonas bivalvium]|uniref:FAD/NAD(P)-binding protein n=1 Tax=Aeromonas bivalvium TaxID=440079 RepID=UPI0005A6A6D4|nr:FAD/NAD(P)-binding protein [Aeromonas bivalvium]